MKPFWPVVLSGLAGVAGPLNGQVFQKTYGVSTLNRASAIAATNDGGAVIAGRVLAANGDGVMLARLDASGTLRWSRIYSIGGHAYSVQLTRDGGYVLAGEVPTGGTVSDAFVLRTDANGNPLWSAQYGDPAAQDRASTIVETRDGGFAFAGYSAVLPAQNAYVVRTDPRGNVTWARTYGSGQHLAKSLLETRDGGFLVVGSASAPAAGGQALVIKTDASGAPTWSKTYGGPAQDWTVGAVELGSGYAVAVSTESFGAGGFDPGLIVLDQQGNLLASNTYGTAISELPLSMTRTPDGDIVIAGVWVAGARYQAFAVRTEASGLLRWSQSYGSANDLSAFDSAAPATDGGLWLVGPWSDNMRPSRMLVAKTNEDGATTCAETDAGFVTGGMSMSVGNGPASQPGPGLRSWGNVDASDPQLTTDTLCFCEGARRTSYGTGWPGSFGVPALVAIDRPVLGRTIALDAGNSRGATTAGLLLLGRQPLDVVTPFDGRLLVQIELALSFAVGATGAQLPLTIPDDPALCGLSVFAQVLELDAGATKGVSFTPGLELQLGM